MTSTHDQHLDDDSIDPSADDDGRIGQRFAAEIGSVLSDRLRDPDLWAMPDPSLADRIARAVASDSSPDVGSGGLRAVGDPGDGGRSAEPDGADDDGENDDGEDRDGEDGDGDLADVRGEVSVFGTMGRFRSALLGAVAALVLVLGGIVGLSILDDPGQQVAFAADMVPTGLIDDVAAAIEVSSDDTGVLIDLSAAGLPRRPDGQYYQGWLELSDGDLVPCGSFRQGGEIPMTAGVDRDDVVAMTITVEEIVAAQSAEQASSEQVVFKVDFPPGG